jgi:hypothetical protein
MDRRKRCPGAPSASTGSRPEDLKKEDPMKKTQINLALNALALAGMLVFAAQTADAASTPSIKDNSPDVTTSQNAPSVTNTTPDVAEVNEVEDAGDVADIHVQDVETPDVAEIDSVPEVEHADLESN